MFSLTDITILVLSGSGSNGNEYGAPTLLRAGASPPDEI